MAKRSSFSRRVIEAMRTILVLVLFNVALVVAGFVLWLAFNVAVKLASLLSKYIF